MDVKGVDGKLLEKLSDKKYWVGDKASKKKGEEAFFKQGDKPEVRYTLVRETQLTCLCRRRRSTAEE